MQLHPTSLNEAFMAITKKAELENAEVRNNSLTTLVLSLIDRRVT